VCFTILQKDVIETVKKQLCTGITDRLIEVLHLSLSLSLSLSIYLSIYLS
jgi:hypothetical protein